MILFIHDDRPVYHLQTHLHSFGVIRVNKQGVVQMDALKDKNTLKNKNWWFEKTFFAITRKRKK